MPSPATATAPDSQASAWRTLAGDAGGEQAARERQRQQDQQQVALDHRPSSAHNWHTLCA